MKKRLLKFSSSDISVAKIDLTDKDLNRRIPILAIQQGKAHDTVLPNKKIHFSTIRDNFCNIIKNSGVEIWSVKKPISGIGAVFLSNLKRNNAYGIQIDDIIIRETFRGLGIGTLLIQFTASLALSRGLKFVSWECEENNSAQKMYRAVGAVPIVEFKPYRLTKELINTLLALNVKETRANNKMFSISNRFSIFRATNFGISGYDMDPTEDSYGVQIEDINFEDIDVFADSLISQLFVLNKLKKINFVDLIINTSNKKHYSLIERLGIKQNTYSGNPAYLWQLHGAALNVAAENGKSLIWS